MILEELTNIHARGRYFKASLSDTDFNFILGTFNPRHGGKEAVAALAEGIRKEQVLTVASRIPVLMERDWFASSDSLSETAEDGKIHLVPEGRLSASGRAAGREGRICADQGGHRRRAAEINDQIFAVEIKKKEDKWEKTAAKKKAKPEDIEKVKREVEDAKKKRRTYGQFLFRAIDLGKHFHSDEQRLMTPNTAALGRMNAKDYRTMREYFSANETQQSVGETPDDAMYHLISNYINAKETDRRQAEHRFETEGDTTLIEDESNAAYEKIKRFAQVSKGKHSNLGASRVVIDLQVNCGLISRHFRAGDATSLNWVEDHIKKDIGVRRFITASRTSIRMTTLK